MDILEEKLLEKMAERNSWREILKSTGKSASTLSNWIACYNNCNSYNKRVDNKIQQNLYNLELHIQLLKKARFLNKQELKEKIVKEIAEKYDIL